MAGLVEATLPPEVRDKVGPALATLRAQAARSRWEDVAKLVEAELGAPIDSLFLRFEHEPFASASLGQVHEATHLDGRRLAVKVQHPGIEEAFTNDLANVGAIAGMATALMMPRGAGRALVDGVKRGFLAELDYVREGENLEAFARLVARDPELEVPELVRDRSSRRALSTTFLRGETVEVARGYPDATRRTQAAAIRRLLFSALADHGLLYADAHAGNFFFREDATVGVLDFGSVFRFDEAERRAFAALVEAAVASDRAAFGRAVGEVLGLEDGVARDAIAGVLWIALGGLVRGEAIGDDRVREITSAAGAMKARLLGARFTLPSFVPFLMRTIVATNALLAKLGAPESGALGRLVVGDGTSRGGG